MLNLHIQRLIQLPPGSWGGGTEFAVLTEPVPPILSLTSFWHVSPAPNHLPPSHCHLFMTCCVTSRLPDDFRSKEWANPFEQFNQIQKDLDHLRNWASRWWMQFKVQKCRIITRGESNSLWMRKVTWEKGSLESLFRCIRRKGQTAWHWVIEAECTKDPGDSLPGERTGERFCLSCRSKKGHRWNRGGSGEHDDCSDRKSVMVTLLCSHFTCSLFTLASWQEVRIYFSLSLGFPCYNISRLMPLFLLLWRMYEIVDVRNACILFWKLKKFTLMNINFIFTMPKKKSSAFNEWKLEMCCLLVL